MLVRVSQDWGWGLCWQTHGRGLFNLYLKTSQNKYNPKGKSF